MVGVITLLNGAASFVGSVQDVEGLFAMSKDGTLRICGRLDGSNEYKAIPVIHEGLADFLLSPQMVWYRRIPTGDFPIFKMAELRGPISTSDDSRNAICLLKLEKLMFLQYGNRRLKFDLSTMTVRQSGSESENDV